MHLCSTWPESVLQKHKLYTYLSQTHACTHKHWLWARLSQLVAPGVRLCCEDARRLCFFCRQPKRCLLLESRSLIKQFTNCLFSNNAKVISLEWEQKLPPCWTAAYKANSVGGKGTGEVGEGGARARISRPRVIWCYRKKNGVDCEPGDAEKIFPSNCCFMSEGAKGGSRGAGGCVESLIRLHIPQELHSSCYEIGYVLRCTGFVISSIVNKISPYGYIARAGHYVRAVF